MCRTTTPAAIGREQEGFLYGTALQAAASVGNTAAVRQLLDAGADVNILEGTHDTVIRAAVQGDHLAVVDMLLRAGADSN